MNEETKNMIINYIKSRKSHNAFFVDGGGTKGIFASEIIQIIGKEKFDKFNILAGTSIGGIIILALRVINLDEYNEVLINTLKKIFGANLFQKIINLIFRKALFSSTKKTKILKKIFGNLKMKDLDKNKAFFVTATNFRTGNPIIFENVSGKWDEKYLWEVANYTSDAPFYWNNFNSPYIDGGVYANDPRTILLNLKVENLIKSNINLFLSIGLNPPYEVLSKEKLRSGWIKKFPRLINMFFNIDSKVNDKWFESNINKKHLRIDFQGDKKIIPISKINAHLIKIAKKEALENKEKIEKFLNQL